MCADRYCDQFCEHYRATALLGVGVAFKICYIMSWRDGKTGLPQSALTRAVIVSAMTNAAAFGSIWVSDYPGISSMGRMMALALLCTMVAAVVSTSLDGNAASNQDKLTFGAIALVCRSALRAFRALLQRR
jgi:hypothetical protein